MIKSTLITVSGIISVVALSNLPGNQVTEGKPLSQTNLIDKIQPIKQTEIEILNKVPVGFDKLLISSGIHKNEIEGIKWIMQQESGICHMKWENERSCPTEYPGDKYSPHDSTKGYGLCQATPAIKYAEMGDDWRTNEQTQIKWCAKYARSYGSVDKAVEFKKCMNRCYSSRTNSFTNKVTPWF